MAIRWQPSNTAIRTIKWYVETLRSIAEMGFVALCSTFLMPHLYSQSHLPGSVFATFFLWFSFYYFFFISHISKNKIILKPIPLFDSVFHFLYYFPHFNFLIFIFFFMYFSFCNLYFTSLLFQSKSILYFWNLFEFYYSIQFNL